MQIVFSTVIRSAPVKQGGELVKLDWKNKKVIARVPIYPFNPEIDDPNPRGNSRGGRGIAILPNGNIIVASYHSLYLYDDKLQFQRSISHPSMVGLHEIHLDKCEDNIWVSATTIDAALKVNITTGEVIRQIWPREIPAFQKLLSLVPMDLDKQADHRAQFLSRKHLEHPSHLHLNAIAIWRDEVYALFHAFGVIVNLDRQEIVIKDRALKGGHNLIIQENGLVTVNDTFGHTVRIYNLNTGHLERVLSVKKFPWVKTLTRGYYTKFYLRAVLYKLGFHHVAIGRPLFLRGLERIGNLLFVGMSPASILCIDETQGKLIDAYNYSKDVNMCIHGLKVLPD